LERAFPALASDLPLQASTRFWLGILAALLTAAVTIWKTRWLVAQTPWARALHLTLRGSLLGATPAQLVLLAGTSACAEELFFRAWLGPSLGFVSSSLLFGSLHGFRRERPFPVALWSFGMGLVFSGLYLASGTLLAPILAHCVINYENMQYICNYDPTPLDMDRYSVSGESESEG
jgi:membrane protease YdiL (CAAX protease family)